MEAEFIKLAQEAVVALQLGPPPNWAEVAGMIVSGVVGVGQIGVIVWGLWRMGKASDARDRQLDQQAETLGKIGQALDRQGEAMTQAFTQQGQALERQGEVLAALLRRPA